MVLINSNSQQSPVDQSVGETFATKDEATFNQILLDTEILAREAGAAFLDKMDSSKDKNFISFAKKVEESRIGQFDSNVTDIFRNENTMVSLHNQGWAGVKSWFIQEPIDTQFDPFKYVGNYDPKYFVRANTIEQVDTIKNRLDKEEAYHDRYSRMPLADRLIGTLGAGVIDPSLFAPMGAVSRGAGFIKNFAAVAASSAAVIGAQEAVLHSDKLTRTKGESAFNIAAGAMLGGVLGGYLGRVPRYQKQAMMNAMSVQMGIQPSSLGAKAVEASGIGSELAASGGMARLLKWLSPQTRLAGLKSQKANLFFEKLLESSGIRKKNVHGTASEVAAETMIKLSQGDQVYITQALDKSYAEYKVQHKDPDISFNDYKNEVFRALFRGDASHIPQAQKLAKEFRTTVLDKWKTEFSNSGLLDLIEKARGDTSYAPRGYDIKKILADPEGFREALMRGFDDSIKRGLGEAQGIKRAIHEHELDVQTTQKEIAGHKDTVSKIKPPKGHVEKLEAQIAEHQRDKSPDIAILEQEKEQAIKNGSEIDALNKELRNKKLTEKEIKELKGEIKDLRAQTRTVKNLDKKIKDLQADRTSEIEMALSNIEEAKVQSGHVEDLRARIQELEGRPTKAIEINKLKERLEEIEYRANMDQSELLESANDVMETITGVNGHNMIQIHSPGGVPKSTKKRMDVSTEYLLDYVNQDVEEVLHQYVREASSATVLKNVFDDVNAGIWREGIREEYSQLIKAAKTPKEVAKLTKERMHVLNDFDYYLKAVQGKPLGSKSNDGMVRVGRFIRGLNSLAMLSNTVLASLSEPVRILTSNGILKTLGKADLVIDSIGAVINKAAPRDLRRIAVGTETIMNSRIGEFMEVGNQFGRNTKSERTLENAQQKFFNLTGLNQWTDAEKIWVGSLYSERVIEAGEKLSVGKSLSQHEITEFASHGLSQEDLVKIHEQYNKFGGDLKNNELYLATDLWGDKGLATKLLATIKKVVDHQVVSKKAGSVPKIFENNEAGRIFSQFLGWGLTASADVTLQIAQRMRMGDIRGFNSLVFMTLMGSVQHMVREKIAGRSTEGIKPAELLYAGFDQSGVGGIFPQIVSRMDSAFGNAISNELGLKSSRYTMKDPLSALLGPTGSMARNISTIGADLFHRDINAGTVHAARRLLPLQNWFVLKQVLDEIEGIVVDTTGISHKGTIKK